MIKGSRIEIHSPIETGTDTFNIPTTKWGLEAVLGDVLAAPASTQDVEGTIRPNGDEITMDFYIPKTYTASLRGRQIHHQGNIYEVIGDPALPRREHPNQVEPRGPRAKDRGVNTSSCPT